MKVKELIKQLSAMDQSLEVILQKDAEGNGYSPLYSVDDDAVYIPDTTWSGKVYDIANWTADDADMDQDEWDEVCANPRCVVMTPVN